MPRQERHKTQYPGVYYIEGTSKATGKPERIYYIMYYRNGRKIEEKAGFQYRDDMTPARASNIRASKINGDKLPNAAKREETSSLTLSELWNQYAAAKAHIKRLKDFEGYFRLHIMPSLGDHTPDSLNPADIDRLRNMYVLDGCAPQSIKHYLSLISRLVKFGVERGLCGPLCFKIEYPRYDNRVTEDLTDKQVQKLLTAAGEHKDPNVSAVIKLALYTGMRKDEMLRLMWEDIDFERGNITIRNPKGVVTIVIPMNRHARKTLDAIPRTESPYVIPGAKGEKRHRNAFARQLRAIRDKAGLPDTFRPLHGLRHVYASRIASSGKVDMYTLQKLLGHKSHKMTERYAHLRDEALRRAADVADEIFD